MRLPSPSNWVLFLTYPRSALSPQELLRLLRVQPYWKDVVFFSIAQEPHDDAEDYPEHLHAMLLFAFPWFEAKVSKNRRGYTLEYFIRPEDLPPNKGRTSAYPNLAARPFYVALSYIHKTRPWVGVESSPSFFLLRLLHSRPLPFLVMAGYISVSDYIHWHRAYLALQEQGSPRNVKLRWLAPSQFGTFPPMVGYDYIIHMPQDRPMSWDGYYGQDKVAIIATGAMDWLELGRYFQRTLPPQVLPCKGGHVYAQWSELTLIWISPDPLRRSGEQVTKDYIAQKKLEHQAQKELYTYRYPKNTEVMAILKSLIN